ncbi:MAG TPA: NAD-dependent succinate-semialdehyde dehydrogenase [Chitinophagaceae bacterium]|nr:NAD-dependent succinate-semialdehyde dehydrogenase [Chitinophagaceae bacterium]
MLLNYINGEYVIAVSGEMQTMINPATEEVIAAITWSNATECRQAIEAAQAAFKTWGKTNVYQRSSILKKAADIIRKNAEDYAEHSVLEAGKPIAEAKGEWMVAANLFEWFAEEAKRAYGRTIPANRNDKRMMTIWQPMGVVGIITAWNFPAYNPARAWAAALAAGCTVVAKASEFTALSTSHLVEALNEAGLPAGVLNNLIGDAASIGEEMLNNPLLKKISFTGSTRVGKLLMDGASKTNTKLSLELGGNAPVIINDDVNVETLAKSAVIAKLRNAGQVCISPQRFFIHEKIYPAFLDAAGDAIKSIKVGFGMDAGTQMGPLINQKQQQYVLQLVGDAEQAGATTVKGELPSEKGWFVPPTLLSNIDANTEAVNKEIFGPVMPVIPFSNRNEVVEWANNTPYGLAGYVWTNNINDAFFFSESLEFGMVGINEWAPHATEAPFGGWKQSGIGHESGSEGLYEYMEKKLVSWGV